MGVATFEEIWRGGTRCDCSITASTGRPWRSCGRSVTWRLSKTLRCSSFHHNFDAVARKAVPTGNIPSGRSVARIPPPDRERARFCRVCRVSRRAGHVGRRPKSVVPRCEYVPVVTRTGSTAARGTVRSEYRARGKRVVGYARPERAARGTIEPVASRSGTPEHRLDRDAAFRCPARRETSPNKGDAHNRSQDNTDPRIGRLSDPLTTPRRPDEGRRTPFDIEYSPTSGESCPTQ